MAGSAQAAEYQEWREGVIIVAAMVVGAAIGAGGLYLLEVPFGEYIGAAIGAVVVFLGYSYVRFGR